VTDLSVELTFDDPALAVEARALKFAQTMRGRPNVTVNASLMAYRLLVINEVRAQIPSQQQVITEQAIRGLMTAVWRMHMPSFVGMVAPTFVAEYAIALRQVNRGQISMATVNRLATEHAQRIGEYFNRTSTEAMLQGFSTYVNRKVPPRVALERTLEAYGITPRQMGGLTSLKDADPVLSATPRDMRAKVKQYIGRSLRNRFKTFSDQEAYNLTNQASQIAWMYQVEHGLIPANTEKVWLTAKDERVCPICGPLHGQVVKVTDQFVSEDGNAFWVPGVHVNCRCKVRIRHPLMNLDQPSGDQEQVDKRFVPIAKAVATLAPPAQWDPNNHPRGTGGRFRNTPDKTQTQSLVEQARKLTEPETVPVKTLEEMWAVQMPNHTAPVGAAVGKPVAAPPKVATKVAEPLTNEQVAESIDIITQTKGYTLSHLAADLAMAEQALGYAIITTAPAKAPAQAPVQAPAQVQAPVETAVEAPVQAPAPAPAPVEAPVKTKTGVPEAPSGVDTKWFYSAETGLLTAGVEGFQDMITEEARALTQDVDSYVEANWEPAADLEPGLLAADPFERGSSWEDYDKGGDDSSMVVRDEHEGLYTVMDKDTYRSIHMGIAFGTDLEVGEEGLPPVVWYSDQIDPHDIGTPRVKPAVVDDNSDAVKQHIMDVEPNFRPENYARKVFMSDAPDDDFSGPAPGKKSGSTPRSFDVEQAQRVEGMPSWFQVYTTPEKPE
jgi:hypothetical protein